MYGYWMPASSIILCSSSLRAKPKIISLEVPSPDGESRGASGEGKEPPLQNGQPAFGGKADKLGVRSHPGLGLDEIVIVLNGLHAEIEI
jgi:hypothetical protein